MGVKRLRSFQYKYLMRIIVTNKLLVKCNITASSICDICNLQIENFNYLFWECTVTQGFWSQVNTVWEKKENSNPFKFPQYLFKQK